MRHVNKPRPGIKLLAREFPIIYGDAAVVVLVGTIFERKFDRRNERDMFQISARSNIMLCMDISILIFLLKLNAVFVIGEKPTGVSIACTLLISVMQRNSKIASG